MNITTFCSRRWLTALVILALQGSLGPSRLGSVTVGKLWVFFKCIYHFDQNVNRGYMLITFTKKTPKQSVATFRMKPLGSFTILIRMYPVATF